MFLLPMHHSGTSGRYHLTLSNKSLIISILLVNTITLSLLLSSFRNLSKLPKNTIFRLDHEEGDYGTGVPFENLSKLMEDSPVRYENPISFTLLIFSDKVFQLVTSFFHPQRKAPQLDN